MSKVTITIELDTKDPACMKELAAFKAVLGGVKPATQEPEDPVEAAQLAEAKAEAERIERARKAEALAIAEAAEAKAKAKAAAEAKKAEEAKKAAEEAKAKAEAEARAKAAAEEEPLEEETLDDDGDPQPAAEPKEKTYTIEEVRAALALKVSDHRQEIKSKLTSLGAPNVTNLDPAKYTEFVNYLESLS